MMTIAEQLQEPFVEVARCSICWESRRLRPDPKDGIWLVCEDCYVTKFESAKMIPGSRANETLDLETKSPAQATNPALQKIG